MLNSARERKSLVSESCVALFSPFVYYCIMFINFELLVLCIVDVVSCPSSLQLMLLQTRGGRQVAGAPSGLGCSSVVSYA